MSADAGVLRSSSVMAVGTIASRVTGMLRNIVLVAAIGGQVFADTYTVANNLPNILYILLVGGALNAVFIPQLVRHMASDSDGGGAYADRLITLSGLVLLAVSALTVALAPFIVRLYSTNSWSSTDLAVSTAFARYCLPQIFFYGVYTLYSQVLNARGHFAMPMFTPILNNLVVIVVCGVFIAAVGPDPTTATITPAETALLGLGTTARHRGAGAGPGPRDGPVRVPLPAPLRPARAGPRQGRHPRQVDHRPGRDQPAGLRGRGAAGHLGQRGGRGGRVDQRRRHHRLHDRVPDLHPAALGGHRVGGHGAAAPDEPRGRRERPARRPRTTSAGGSGW